MNPKKTMTLAALLLTLATPLAPAVAEDVKTAEERALEQTVTGDELFSTDRHEISAGHVDMGPRFVEGRWELMFRDDSAAQPVWRDPSDTVLATSDAALLPVPDDSRYSFVQADPGSEVYVIPQTELAGVVWPGWNTQDPEVVSRLGRGVTFTLEDVEGPGNFSLYLENGNFSAPQVLWSSDSTDPQDIWVDPNTHTHANWVFTAPGIYFLTVKVHAELADGSSVADTARLQFAVGDHTDAQQVFEAAAALPALDGQDAGASARAEGTADTAKPDVATEDSAATESAVAEVSDSAAQNADGQGASPLLFVGAGLVLAVLAGGIFLAVRRSSTAQKEALEHVGRGKKQ